MSHIIHTLLSDLPAEEICNVDWVTLPYPLITLQPGIILQNENKQLLPATEPQPEWTIAGMSLNILLN